MMDIVAPVILGVGGAQLAVQYSIRLLRRWLTLRCRTELTRAAVNLPAGVHVEGRDSAGTWSASNTARRPR